MARLRLIRVVMSGQTRAHLTQLHLQAALAGKGHAFLKAFAAIIGHLTNHPLTFGEALCRLPAARLQVRLAVIAPLVVDYGVYRKSLSSSSAASRSCPNLKLHNGLCICIFRRGTMR